MQRYLLSLLLFLPAAAFSLWKEPWFGNAWQFELDTGYTFSRYRQVNHGHPHLSHPSNDSLFLLGCGVTPVLDWNANWSIDIETEVVHTPRQKFGFRSVAAQGRRRWLDDISGDPISLTTGVSARWAFTPSLRDVSSPYHAHFNAELNAALGKEWAQGAFWRLRTFAFFALGMANRGSPWASACLSFQTNDQNLHQFQAFSGGYFGFGKRREVNIDHFNGYAHIHHQSVDIGVGYRYLLALWGSFSFEYAYRVYARSFPAHVNFFIFRYQLPFSLF